MSDRIDAELVYRALEMALRRRDVSSSTTLTHHSDRGSQYSSEMIQQLLTENSIGVSMSRRGDPFDNAMMEGFFSLHKSEWTNDPYETWVECELEIFKYIEMFYIRIKTYKRLNYISPMDFERQYERERKASESAACLLAQ
ncbi:MAG: DDE-type integrase/transposase/recombinase [Candidatus Lokiarchaeota archaeon]|nr:DDE-type integrase/transposase/recombinase [Candidatus Lokiarchaeota archaeon]